MISLCVQACRCLSYCSIPGHVSDSDSEEGPTFRGSKPCVKSHEQRRGSHGQTEVEKAEAYESEHGYHVSEDGKGESSAAGIHLSKVFDQNGKLCSTAPYRTRTLKLTRFNSAYMIIFGSNDIPTAPSFSSVIRIKMERNLSNMVCKDCHSSAHNMLCHLQELSGVFL